MKEKQSKFAASVYFHVRKKKPNNAVLAERSYKRKKKKSIHMNWFLMTC